MELSVTFNLNNTRILFTGNFRPKKIIQVTLTLLISY